MAEVTLRDFSGGLVDYFSPTDISDNQFQDFVNLNNDRLGRVELEKVPESITSSLENLGYNYIKGGYGFYTYKTERDGSGEFNPTNWFIVLVQEYSTLKIYRYDESGQLSGTFEKVLTHETGSEDINDWSGNIPTNGGMIPDYYSANNILRISDSNFSNNHKSKWYGYVNQKRFGQGLTFNTASTFYTEPSIAETVSEWYLTDQHIQRPVVYGEAFGRVGTGGLFREFDNYDVQLYVKYPTGTGDTSLIDDLSANTFDENDRYTCTFVYENGQESTLGKTTDDEFGITPFGTFSATKCPAIHITVGKGLNKRIKGINVYWRRGSEKTNEWYLVTQLDINRAFLDQPNATTINSNYNMGSWIATPNLQTLRSSIALNSSDSDTWGTGTDLTLSGGGSYNDTNLIVWVGNGTAMSTFGDPPNNDDRVSALSTLLKTDTMIGRVGSLSDGNSDIEVQDTSGDTPITYKGVNISAPHSSSYVLWGALPRDSCISTWFYPNDGLLGSTYQSRTGREQDEVIQPIRWKSSVVANDYVFIGNTDTKDGNDQTVREQSKVFYSRGGDDFDIIRSKEFGLNDGDEIVSLEYYSGRLYVIKEKNVHVYNISSPQFYIEKTYKGIGCLASGATCVTPYGVCTSDNKGIYLINESQHIELSQPIREKYQDYRSYSSTSSETQRDFQNPVIGYDSNKNGLLFIPTTIDSKYINQPNMYTYPVYNPLTDFMYFYSFDTKSWKCHLMPVFDTKGVSNNLSFVSNLMMGSDGSIVNTYHYMGNMNVIADVVKNFNKTVIDNSIINNIGKAYKVVTKKFDFGSPFRNKKLKKIGLTYKSDSDVNIRVYNQNGEIFSKTLSSTSALVNKTIGVYSMFKTLEINIGGISLDFVLEDISVDYEIKGNPVNA